MKTIRTNPLFELYVENDFLIINNSQHLIDNARIKIANIASIQLIRELSFWNKIMEVTFGFLGNAKSEMVRIRFDDGYKDIVVTDCETKKVESLIYKVNSLILKTQNHTS